jgi:D-alanine-D-alanine ligase
VSLEKLHVAVLMGGWSSERPVSLMSGEGVAKALESRGHRVTRIDMDRNVALRLAECSTHSTARRARTARCRG